MFNLTTINYYYWSGDGGELMSWSSGSTVSYSLNEIR